MGYVFATMQGRPAGWQDGDTESFDGHRQLVVRLLLEGYLSAMLGDAADVAWLDSRAARQWADLIDLPCWPPKENLTPRQLVDRAEMLGIRLPRTEKARYLRKGDRDALAAEQARYAALFSLPERVSSSVPLEAVTALWSHAIGPVGTYSTDVVVVGAGN